MGKRGGAGLSVVADARAVLAGRLGERAPELKAAIATRVYSIADPDRVSDPAYRQSLDVAVVAAVEHRLALLAAGERQAPELPSALLAQARLDARDGVPLDTVLRRYIAGNALFADFLGEESERAALPSAALRRLLAEQASLGDRLLAAVSSEYAHEQKLRPTGPAERRRECVKRLLAGELVDHSELAYDLDDHHLALLARGEGVEEPLRAAAKRLDRRLLAVRHEEEPTWACWLGGRRPLAVEEALGAIGEGLPEGAVVTAGEPAEGLVGWRLSHLQAKAAMPIAQRRAEPVVRYADVALLAAAVRDDLLATSLRRLYLAPLERMRDGGEVARETLRAYFAAERNVSSTAAALGVDRRTVRTRIAAVETVLGRPLHLVAMDLELALRLDA